MAIGRMIELAATQPWWTLAALAALTGAGRRRRRGKDEAPSGEWCTVSAGYGWQPDPMDDRRVRFHDGQGWTDMVASDGVTRCEPMEHRRAA